MLAVLAMVVLLVGAEASDVRLALAAGDAAGAKMEYDKALEAYQIALRAAPDDPETLWRLSRAYVIMGEVAEGTERKRLLGLAEQFGRKCIARDSTCSEGHAWLAGALGYIALEAGPADQVKILREILHEANTVLKLNPRDDKAYSILGSVYRALGNVGWVERQFAALLWGGLPPGGHTESEEALKKAIQLAPDVMRHYYELGVLYIDMDRPEEAQKALEHARTLPIRVAIDLPRLKKIDELLSSLKHEVKAGNN